MPITITNHQLTSRMPITITSRIKGELNLSLTRVAGTTVMVNIVHNLIINIIILRQGSLFWEYFTSGYEWGVSVISVPDKDQPIHLSGSLINNQNDQGSWVQCRTIIKSQRRYTGSNQPEPSDYEASSLPLCYLANHHTHSLFIFGLKYPKRVVSVLELW
jgi:hypothetical protein